MALSIKPLTNGPDFKPYVLWRFVFERQEDSETSAPSRLLRRLKAILGVPESTCEFALETAQTPILVKVEFIEKAKQSASDALAIPTLVLLPRTLPGVLLFGTTSWDNVMVTLSVEDALRYYGCPYDMNEQEPLRISGGSLDEQQPWGARPGTSSFLALGPNVSEEDRLLEILSYSVDVLTRRLDIARALAAKAPQLECELSKKM